MSHGSAEANRRIYIEREMGDEMRTEVKLEEKLNKIGETRWEEWKDLKKRRNWKRKGSNKKRKDLVPKFQSS